MVPSNAPTSAVGNRNGVTRHGETPGSTWELSLDMATGLLAQNTCHPVRDSARSRPAVGDLAGADDVLAVGRHRARRVADGALARSTSRTAPPVRVSQQVPRKSQLGNTAMN